MFAVRSISERVVLTATQRRGVQASAPWRAITKFNMPAMSPTMTEGGIASWKKKEGETFAVGDVLLEIETDKATIDVEAQDDGVLGKILAPDGAKNIPVGKVIALLAEEGDDISNIESPKEDEQPIQSASSSEQKPSLQPPSTTPESSNASSAPPSRSSLESTHRSPKRPVFPSVLRLLQEHSIDGPDADKIKGTGVRGMLTKGDVLTYLGKASGPLGSFKAALDQAEEKAKSEKTIVNKLVEQPALDGPALRRLIVSQMLEASQKVYKPVGGPTPTFDDIIADYLPSSAKATVPAATPSKVESRPADDFHGIL